MTLAGWQQRVVDEKDELMARLNKLRAFMDTPQALALPFVDRCALVRQADAMHEYADALLDRIDRFFDRDDKAATERG